MSTVPNARGTRLFDGLPRVGVGAGIKTTFGTLLPPDGEVVAYVDSNGVQDGDDHAIKDMVVLTLAAALNRCRAGKNDIIVVRPGHAENVALTTDLDNLVAGTRIVGYGHGANMPTFTWTATTSQWAIDNADVQISGLRLAISGAVVVKGIVITAADCVISDCEIVHATGASNKATIAIEVGSAGLDCTIAGCRIRGTKTHNSTDVIKLVGGTVPSGFRFIGNEWIGSATAANGVVHITVAALDCVIANNMLYNTHTSSTSCVTVDNVAADGILAYNTYCTMNDGTATAQGAVLGAAALFKTVECYSVDEPIKSGILTPAAGT